MASIVPICTFVVSPVIHVAALIAVEIRNARRAVHEVEVLALTHSSVASVVRDPDPDVRALGRSGLGDACVEVELNGVALTAINLIRRVEDDRRSAVDRVAVDNRLLLP
jgi:hypothetical protein